MKPAPFDFQRPGTLRQALDAYAAEPEAKILAGGQSLIPLMSMRVTAVSTLIDINGIGELSHISVDETGVRFGAIVRHSELLDDPRVQETQPLIGKALECVAHATIRNRGTTVGSIVHADASGEMPMILGLTGGSLTVASAHGTRTIHADDVFVGPMETSLHPGEIATEAFMPARAPGSGVGYQEVARRHGDYALCGAGAIVTLDRQGAIDHARIGFVAMSEVPAVVDVTACFAHGQITDDGLAAAADLALGHLDPETDIHGTAEYRSQLARTLTARVIKAAEADACARVEEGK